MPKWWDELLRRTKKTAVVPNAPPKAQRAQWLATGDARNPFAAPILDLMELQEVIATSADPACAARSVSWSNSIGQELDAAHLLQLPSLACSLRYPAANSVPDGMLYVPPSMDFKWVFALREGRLLAARSWTGAVEAVADVRRDGDTFVVERLRIAEASSLRGCSRLVDVFDWLLRVHIWEQRLPLPVDDAYAELLASAPLSGFGPFGKALFCASKSWAPPPVARPLRSDGEVIRAACHADLVALRHAVANGADINAPAIIGYTALHVAIIKGDVVLFDELVRLGADPTAIADRGMHALGLAVVHRAPLALFERLAATGLDMTLANADGFNALHAAAECNAAAMVPWLVAHGLPLEARTVHGHTALHITYALGHAETAKALLIAGADIFATSPTGTPLELAIAEKRSALVSLLAARSRALGR
jgi:hypothetical protein